MKTGDFLIQVFREDINGRLVEGAIFPQVEGGEGLVGEARTHHEAGVTGGTTQIHQATFRQKVEFPAVGEYIFVELWFDVDPA